MKFGNHRVSGGTKVMSNNTMNNGMKNGMTASATSSNSNWILRNHGNLILTKQKNI
ncbi:MAG: hypothetical protein ACTSX7_01560 [Alphaproteobacteria bacterium]